MSVRRCARGTVARTTPTVAPAAGRVSRVAAASEGPIHVALYNIAGTPAMSMYIYVHNETAHLRPQL